MSKTKRLKLTQGKYAIVDADDYARLVNYNWAFQNNNGAVSVSQHRARCSITLGQNIMHPSKNMHVVPKNGNALDFRKSNLLVCSISAKIQHAKLRNNKTSKFKGVCWWENGGKWKARIQKAGIVYWLGYFDNEIDAARAYDEKALEIYGTVAFQNFGNLIQTKYSVNLFDEPKKRNPHRSRPYSNSASRFKGVHFNPCRGKKWRVQIIHRGKFYNLGCYDNEIEAAKAYDAKAKELLGDDCYLNFPSNQKRKGA